MTSKNILVRFCQKIIPFYFKRKLESYFLKKNNVTSHKQILEFFKDKGLVVETFLDIGAFQGEFALDIWACFPESNGYLFEPELVKLNKLQNNTRHFKRTIEAMAIGATSGHVQMSCDGGGGSFVADKESSINPLLTTVKMISLDDYCTKKEINKVDIIKIDVQGFEKDVYDGGAVTFKKASVIIVELSFIPLGKYCPDALVMINKFDQLGFRIFDITSFWRRPVDGALWQADFVFVKKESLYGNVSLGW